MLATSQEDITQLSNMLAPHSPFEAVGDLLTVKVGAYSVLQLAVGGVAILGVIAGARWAFGKALGNG
jgi:hypothetical protein